MTQAEGDGGPESRQRHRAADPGRWTAPASGLFLERVRYPGDPPLPPLAAVTPIVRPPAPSAPPPAGKPPRRRGAR